MKTALQSVANVLQVSVTCNTAGKITFPPETFRHQLDGKSGSTVTPAIQYVMKPVASYHSEADSTGVLVHVSGDLFILVSHYHQTKATSAFVIDGRRSNIQETGPQIARTSTLKEVFELLRKGIVKTFLFDGASWVAINNL